MKAILAVFSMSVSLMAGATESKLSTKAESTTPPKASQWSADYAIYHYEMEGTSTANTKIYKFGDATVDLQLFTLKYQAAPTWTLLTFVPYIKNGVETIYEPVAGGLNFKTVDHTEGLSDVRFMAMNLFAVKGKHLGFYDLGFTLPTGQNDAKFNSSPTQGASYNMQPGSGTVDPIVGLTYSHLTSANWTQTARAQYTGRLGRTAKGYALGDELQMNLASKYKVLSFLSGGLQFNYKDRGAVQGKDTRYEKFNNWQTAASSGDGHQYYHGHQINYDLTASVKAEYAKAGWPSFALEGGVPLWQEFRNLDDIRLDTRYWVSGAVSQAF